MNKIAFFDRDGVINHEPGHYTCSVDEFLINSGIWESIKLLKDNGYIVVVISNQGGIAKGLYTSDDVLLMHKKLQNYLSEFQTSIDDFYFCPHHDKITKCLCRKPEPLMFEKALYIYDADPNQSFMIGDSKRDIIAAEKAGIKGFKIEPNENILNLCTEIISK